MEPGEREIKNKDESSFLACQEVTPVSDVLICEGASQSFVHCPQLPRYCAERIRLLCRTDTLIVRKGYGYCADRIRLLCRSDTVIVQIGYGCCADRIRLLCGTDTVVMQVGCGYWAERIRLLCRTDTEALFVFRLLPLMKGCGWMTCHVIIHIIVMHVKKKTNSL